MKKQISYAIGGFALSFIGGMFLKLGCVALTIAFSSKDE